MRGAVELTEFDMTPVFLPAGPQSRQIPGGRDHFSTDDLDDDSMSSLEDPETVFRPYVRPLAPDDQAEGPDLYEENYGRSTFRRQQLELHDPMSDSFSGTLPSAAFLLSPALDSNIQENEAVMPSELMPRDDGTIAFNYMCADAIRPADAPQARSMAALLRERYLRLKQQRDQSNMLGLDQTFPGTQPPRRTQEPGSAQASASAAAMSIQSPLSVAPHEQSENLSVVASSPEGNAGFSIPFFEASRGVPRRPLLAPPPLGDGDSNAALTDTAPFSTQKGVTSQETSSREELGQPSETQAARQPSFAQRRARARAQTPRVPFGAESEGSVGHASDDPQSPQHLDRASYRRGSGMPPAILRERRDVDTALYRI